MSVGTNENVNIKNINPNINEEENIVEEVNTVNTGENKPVIDMQATQRITFLDELKNKANEPTNIPNSSSEVSAEPIAQAENYSANNMSENEVQKIPNQEINETSTQEKENDDVKYVSDTNAVPQISQENSTEETQINKEKQHAQDKKDYRLERMLFDRINKMQGKIKESLELIKKFERINAKEENLPNIVTTLHDKLTHEVIKQFRTVGIEFNMKSYLVQAVVSDLLGKFEEGITEFKDCSENLNFVREVQDDFESRVELAPTSKVKNFFARLRGMFKPERKQEKLEQLERERQEKKLEEANIHLIKYKFINSELEKYTIRKNIVNSLTREILHGQGSGVNLNVKDFINEKIAPEMKKLGLENLNPDLEGRLYNEYKEKNPEISQESFNQILVGELRRSMKMQRAEIVRSKINTVVADRANDEEDERLAI